MTSVTVTETLNQRQSRESSAKALVEIAKELKKQNELMEQLIALLSKQLAG